MLNFEWYRTFKAIYQSGTLTGAAQELLISQPNVSQHLSSLEAYIGKQLFERQPRKMVPTAYGKLFYTQIIESVERLEGVETDFRHIAISKEIAMTCLGAPREFFEAVMADRLGKTDVNLHVEFGTTKELMKRLLKGDISFLIATQKQEEPNIVYEPCLDETFLLIGSPGMDIKPFSQLIKAGALHKAEEWLCDQNWFAHNSDLMIIRRYWLNNFGKRPPVKPRFIIPDFDSVLRAIQHGNGVTVIPDYLVKTQLKNNQLQELWPGNKKAVNTLYLAYDKTKAPAEQVEMMRILLNMKK
ncbi:LysR family transcriptional regulator [Chitinophaga sp. SYP-B3965]|uniref:LysR family transcriptional regulator n=1 Tax=Chitinophaga sp. SYP-B3965 TaxID=2663120 RepID=UPI0012995166|nr:LysR family transcriptional regulator [Chitinophaga sp. SYP-B3965]MRG48826.1 LysR family transcriptional regulator [Chitinophaga sp. SYP-B3965]